MPIVRQIAVVVAVLLFVPTARAQPPVDRRAEPADRAAREPKRFHTSLSFRDIDLPSLQQRLERFGLRLPLTIAGRASVRITIGFPWGALFHAKAYELRGEIQSPRLTIESIEFERFAARLHYLDGVFSLEELAFDIAGERTAPQEAALPAHVAGTARMELIPRGALTARANISNVAAAQFQALSPALAMIESGVF
ncbi:MAG TPA: hypothetical protein VG713_07790, partial [Pirellulales bacterium]|nr:hypothetical protein [Pirellulales bacterium]